MATAIRTRERGAALLLTLFALLLLSAIGLFMVLSADTETRIDANYSTSLSTYYAARSGVEEVRDRLKYPWATNPAGGGLADLLPQDVAGNAGGVLYVLNPAGGEVVDPTDPSNRYFDTQLCHDYPSGVPNGTKCNVVPSTAGWNLAPQTAMTPAIGPMGYKWVRINMKTNGIGPYPVDSAALAGARICWDGQTEQVSPGGVNPACDANGMQTVYMLTALAATPGPAGLSASKVLRAEVAAPSIRPPGAITMDAPDAAVLFGSSGSGIPNTAIDGRPHAVDGSLSSSGRCSAVSALGSDTTQTSSRLQQSLDDLRFNIVTVANNSCNADGSSIGSNTCTPGLWWVRGTDPTPRFITSGGTSTASSPTPTPTPAPTPTPTPSEHHGHDGHDSTPTPTPVPSPTPTPIATPTPLPPTTSCDPSDPTCYTNLNLAAPELLATSAFFAPQVPAVTLPLNPTAPFVGGPGNQADSTVYQSGSALMMQNSIAALNTFVAANSSKPNYFAVSAASLSPSYGTSANPAIVVITDPNLKLTSGASLTGFGILVVPNDLEINNATLQWTGLVLVQGTNGQFVIGPGANGFINGGLMLQSGSTLNLQTTTTGAGSFRIAYSCEVIDVIFGAVPFKVVGSSESSL